MTLFRRLAKKYLPNEVMYFLKTRQYAHRKSILEKSDSLGEVFSAIYSRSMWGGHRNDFYSGHGSHDPQIVDPYVRAVSEFLASFTDKPDVCDLGCGDFSVGSQIRPFCKRYIAADIVPDLIERNRGRFANADVVFSHINMVTDTLPMADVVFIRQVLQHLSNDDVSAVVPKLSQFCYVVITEGLPDTLFEPNHDKSAGFDIRLKSGSGIDITAPPFSFPVKSSRVLCEVPDGPGAVIRTIVYEPA